MKNEKRDMRYFFYILLLRFLFFFCCFLTFFGDAQAATHNYAELKGMFKCPVVLRGDPENRKFISKQRHALTYTHTRMLCTSTCELCDSNKKQLKVPRPAMSWRLANVIHTVTTHTHPLTFAHSPIYIHVYCVAATPTSTRLIHILFRHCCCCWRRLLA